jgi:sulfide:quinone oxidoreductase
MSNDTHSQPFHVLIAGGGVAALEAMMAVRELAGDDLQITLLAPERDFHYRPMTVAEPFAIAQARHIALVAICADFGARHVTGALAGVEAEQHLAVTTAGDRIGYDALVIACGTHLRPAYEGVITVDDATLGATIRGLVQDVEMGYTHEIAFVAPTQAFWPLPLYELALLTAHRAYEMNVAVSLSIVTPETAPLTLFGAAVSDEVARRLREVGIHFRGSSFAEYAHGELTLQPSGATLRPDRVVALPLLDGPQLTGVPADPHGFIVVDEDGAVAGLDGVYAAGDVTSHAIKHGGIAAQQADVAAAAIATRAGFTVDEQPPATVLRGILLTGGTPCFLEAELGAGGVVSASASDSCPWDPPTKVAARHLGPYLARGTRYAVPT